MAELHADSCGGCRSAAYLQASLATSGWLLVRDRTARERDVPFANKDKHIRAHAGLPGTCKWSGGPTG